MAGNQTFYDYERQEMEHNAENRKFYRKPKHETLAEHRKHCQAQPGDCPFERLYNEADDLIVKDPEKKPDNYERLAQTMTGMFQFAKDISKDMEADHKESNVVIGESLNKAIQAIQETVEKAGCIVRMNEEGTQYVITPPNKPKAQ